MRKTIIYILLALTSLMLVGCNNETQPSTDPTREPTPTESVVADTIKPVIMIDSRLFKLEFNLGEEIEDLEALLLEGVSAIDNVDGIITDQILIEYNDFDINIPGIYEIGFYVYDSSGNKSEVKYKTITVKEAYEMYEAYPVYRGIIEDEKPKPAAQRCFAGAWYHKVVSARDKWFGIEGTIVLPEVDINRYSGNANLDVAIDPDFKNLDNPSIYLGGNAVFESDVGLSLSRVLVRKGGTDVLTTGSYAFRPFWRYITNMEKDEGGYDTVNDRYYAVSCNGNNCIANYHFMYTEYYYLPGDELRIIVYSPEENYLQMIIEVVGVSTLPSSVQIRKDNGWKDPESFVSPVFSSPGHGKGINVEFKRVNAIDQVANEGKPAVDTTSEVTNAIWKSVYLYRTIDNQNYRIPFNEHRSATMNCPDPLKFSVTPIDESTGGSTITIHPGR